LLSNSTLYRYTVAWEALCSLPNLAILALDNNALRGPLPACIGTLPKLEAGLYNTLNAVDGAVQQVECS
jgi:hypothetical protein